MCTSSLTLTFAATFCTLLGHIHIPKSPLPWWVLCLAYKNLEANELVRCGSKSTSQRVGAGNGKHMLTACTGHEYPSVLFIASPGGDTTTHYHLLHRNRDVPYKAPGFSISCTFYGPDFVISPSTRVHPVGCIPCCHFRLWENAWHTQEATRTACSSYMICHSFSRFGGMAKSKRLDGDVELDVMEPTVGPVFFGQSDSSTILLYCRSR